MSATITIVLNSNVVLFPPYRDVGHVRRIATRIERRTGSPDKFWRTEVNRLYARLQVFGIPHENIEAEIDRFAAAVRAEIRTIRAEHEAEGVMP